MNELLSIFATWQFILLCTGISAFCFFVRTIIESMILNNPNMPGNSKSKFWRDVFLVLLPVVCGFVFPLFAKTFIYPVALTDIYSKFLFSSSAGLIAPTAYRVIKALLWKNVSDSAPEVVNQFPVLNNLQNEPTSTVPTADDINPDEPKI